MTDSGLDRRILLHLRQCDAALDDTPAPRAVSTPGIGDAVLPDTDVLSDWVSFLSALSALEDRGLVRTRVADVAGLDEERNVYALTEDGRTQADDAADAAASTTVTVVDRDSERETTLDAFIDAHPDYDLVDALIALTDDDTLYVEDDATGGFVNRADELDAFEATLDAVRDGDGRTILTVGEPGAGKTTLLAEVESRARDRGFHTAVVRCPRDVDDPFQPHRRALVDELGVFDASPFEDAHGDTVDDADDLAAERAALFNEIADAVADAADDAPLFVAFDDVQWCDEPSLELLVHLTRQLADAPVAFVATSRPVDIAADHPLTDLADADTTTRIDLDPFDRTATRDLVRTVVGDTDVPESFVDRIHDRTGGTPLFVAESVRHLLEDGLIQPEYGVYPMGDDADHTPDAVGDAIAHRFDALPDTTTDVLRRGAVIGERISLDVLADAAPFDRPTVEDHVDLLVASRIWDRDGDDAVVFRNGVVRECVLDGIPDSERRALHAAVADDLADNDRDDPDDYARLAHHYESAGDYDAAIDYYRRAGDHAKTVYAHEVALQQYEHALSLAHDHAEDDVPDLMTAIGDTATTIGDYDTADRHFQYVRERTSDPATEQEMYYRQSEIRIAQSDYDAAIELADAGLELAGDEPTEETCRLLAQKGWGYMQQADFDTAADIFERERELADSVGDRAEARALHNLGTVNWQRGEPEEARATLERAVEMWDRIGDDKELARAHNSLGAVELQSGNSDAAAGHIERALDILETIGETRGVATLYNNLGTLYMNRGEWDAALERFEDGIPLSESIGDRQGVAHKLGNAAVVHLHRGDFEQARDYIERSRDIRRDINDQQGLVFAEVVLGRLALRDDRLTDARDAVRRAQSAAEDVEADTPFPELARLRGDTERAAGNTADAIAVHRDGIDAASEHGDDDGAIANRSSLALDYAAAGDGDAAVDAASAAADAIQDRQDAILELDTHLALARAHATAGNRDDAESTLDALAARARDVGAAWYRLLADFHRARVHAAAGDTERAHAALADVRDDAEHRDLAALADRCERELADLPQTADD